MVRAKKLLHISVSALCFLSLAACANQMQKGANQLGKGVGPDGRPIVAGTQRDFSINVGDTVHFTTDSSQLTPDAQSTLQAQVKWLQQYPQFTITIQGHADERGTREYNIALGAKRAEAVRRFLAGNGVNPRRMRTISYGKERPVATCDDISCWSRNRRARTQLNRRAGS